MAAMDVMPPATMKDIAAPGVIPCSISPETMAGAAYPFKYAGAPMNALRIMGKTPSPPTKDAIIYAGI